MDSEQQRIDGLSLIEQTDRLRDVDVPCMCRPRNSAHLTSQPECFQRLWLRRPRVYRVYRDDDDDGRQTSSAGPISYSLGQFVCQRAGWLAG